ncbi:pole-organizing protein PopZ [Glycocaulis albus]|uniref:Pole-organizing protein PopZ n=1 Tax=Glycocaulis albus TaxID=1382801 RepID=A0ABQ1XYM2_9PROT|nr:DUF2497 domain-containing protein [Glycocaulis albus]GGH07246.1 pole-organizing protein PopZ [Glycocaulis albus]
MAQSNAEQEPTMEEILASIRRIINEDDEPQAEAAPAAPEPAAEAEPAAEPQPEPALEAAPEPEPAPEAEDASFDDDVLELTDRIEDEGEGTSPMAIADDLMIVDREDELAAEPQAEPEPEPEPEPVMAEAPKPAPAEDDDSLLAEPAASAAAGAFAALTENLRVSSENGQTLEGIVRELMRPMLKQWLDENLPSIVEAKVQEEIERVARRRR